MKKNHLFVLIFVLGCIIFILYNTLASEVNTYPDIIQKSFSRDVDDMYLIINKTSSLNCRDIESYDVSTGSKKNSFSVNSNEGVKLWVSKQLFRIIAESETYTKKLILENSEYYMIQMNFDYESGTKSTDIYKLYLFVNIGNYHIIIPEHYIEPHNIGKISTNYYDYEPNEVIKSLVNHII